LIFFAGAVIIGIATTWYTNVLVKRLEKEEKQRMEIWAEATKQLLTINEEDVDMYLFVDRITKENETIPVITVDENDHILSARNLRLFGKNKQPVDLLRLQFQKLSEKNQKYLRHQLKIMKKQHEPIKIDLREILKNMRQKGYDITPEMLNAPDMVQYLYYKDSILLTRIQYFPFVQLAVIFLFILFAYLAFSSSRRAEQNQVWVGMSKETAHQLGTPISSLMAWVELLKIKEPNPEIIQEIVKDVKRLETITDRFSKIGSAPVLMPEDVLQVLRNAIHYLESRTSDKISFNLHFGDLEELIVPLNLTLFEWVIENLCRNAIDAMDGVGRIDISVEDQNQVVYIDVADSGKGISKSNYQVVFQPGYTTKQRGWGLGLSLVKRIIENYHSGKVFVRSSEIGRGTDFRIVLKKQG